MKELENIWVGLIGFSYHRFLNFFFSASMDTTTFPCPSRVWKKFLNDFGRDTTVEADEVLNAAPFLWVLALFSFSFVFQVVISRWSRYIPRDIYSCFSIFTAGSSITIIVGERDRSQRDSLWLASPISIEYFAQRGIITDASQIPHFVMMKGERYAYSDGILWYIKHIQWDNTHFLSAFILSCRCMYYTILLKISALIFSFPFLKV